MARFKRQEHEDALGGGADLTGPSECGRGHAARRALQLSLNVPAVALLDSVGSNRLNARLTQAGASLVLPKGEAPGLADDRAGRGR